MHRIDRDAMLTVRYTERGAVHRYTTYASLTMVRVRNAGERGATKIRCQVGKTWVRPDLISLR